MIMKRDLARKWLEKRGIRVATSLPTGNIICEWRRRTRIFGSMNAAYNNYRPYFKYWRGV